MDRVGLTWPTALPLCEYTRILDSPDPEKEMKVPVITLCGRNDPIFNELRPVPGAIFVLRRQWWEGQPSRRDQTRGRVEDGVEGGWNMSSSTHPTVRRIHRDKLERKLLVDYLSRRCKYSGDSSRASMPTIESQADASELKRHEIFLVPKDYDARERPAERAPLPAVCVVHYVQEDAIPDPRVRLPNPAITILQSQRCTGIEGPNQATSDVAIAPSSGTPAHSPNAPTTNTEQGPFAASRSASPDGAIPFASAVLASLHDHEHLSNVPCHRDVDMEQSKQKAQVSASARCDHVDEAALTLLESAAAPIDLSDRCTPALLPSSIDLSDGCTPALLPSSPRPTVVSSTANARVMHYHPHSFASPVNVPSSLSDDFAEDALMCMESLPHESAHAVEAHSTTPLMHVSPLRCVQPPQQVPLRADLYEPTNVLDSPYWYTHSEARSLAAAGPRNALGELRRDRGSVGAIRPNKRMRCSHQAQLSQWSNAVPPLRADVARHSELTFSVMQQHTVTTEQMITLMSSNHSVFSQGQIDQALGQLLGSSGSSTSSILRWDETLEAATEVDTLLGLSESLTEMLGGSITP